MITIYFNQLTKKMKAFLKKHTEIKQNSVLTEHLSIK